MAPCEAKEKRTKNVSDVFRGQTSVVMELGKGEGAGL